MTQDHKTALLSLYAAEAAERSAREKLVDLERAVKEQQKAVADAVAEKDAAQMAADRHLPPVVIVFRSRYAGETRAAGAILRRTNKSITAKRIGDSDCQAQQFRPSKYQPNRWIEYPAPKGFGIRGNELEFPDA